MAATVGTAGGVGGAGVAVGGAGIAVGIGVAVGIGWDVAHAPESTKTKVKPANCNNSLL
ncbi:MAG: hypothetical protein ABSB61_09225 [Anaerolineales bacterium]